MKPNRELEVYDDVWMPSQCGRCFSMCAIRVHRVNGVAVRIEGNPESCLGSQGGTCGKGAAGLQVLYDPNRLNVPLKRTNPEKGLHVDPKWKEITWDEALSEIAEKLKAVLADNPKKILLQSATMRAPTSAVGWRNVLAALLGTPNVTVSGAGIHCGNGAHYACCFMHSSWDVLPDYELCNYAIYWGVHNGHGTGHGAMVSARRVAEAMERGMKLVVFDPQCVYSAGKATEWIPLIPGTDGAVALAMSNVILNDLSIWDAGYIKMKTNGPYLVGSDGRFVRDGESGKPLVWDAGESKPKVYDDVGISDFALEGIYEVNGARCHPAFQLFKDNVKKYTPEMASKVSSVPAKTIRRIAEEFAHAAQVGSTITIGGHNLPLRPVSSTTFRGGEAHANAGHTVMAILLLNHILGAADVPGGVCGFPNTSQGYPGTGELKFGVTKGADGMLTAGRWFGHTPWPITEPKYPTDAGLRELFTLCSFSPIWGAVDKEELWEKIKFPYRIEVMLSFGANSVLGIANPDTYADFLKKMSFIVHWDLFTNEFSEGFADIVLPDTSYLESFSWMDGQGFFFNYPHTMEPWTYHITQPIVKPQGERRFIIDVSLDLLDRLGKRADVNDYWNKYLGLEENEKFQPTEKITWEQIGDKALKRFFGPDHGVDWFKEHGVMQWPKKVEEAYWRCFTDARVPVYQEFMVDLKGKIKKIADEVGVKVNWDHYTPFTEWFPCPHHLVNDPQYDLYCFSYRDTLHTGSCTQEQPWLDEASRMRPHTYGISMSHEAAKERGLKQGDLIEVESVYGGKVRGKLALRKGQHPETLSMVSSGKWSKSQPIAQGKGPSFTRLLEIKFEECCPLTFNMETCVKVRVKKVGGKEA